MGTGIYARQYCVDVRSMQQQSYDEGVLSTTGGSWEESLGDAPTGFTEKARRRVSSKRAVDRDEEERRGRNGSRQKTDAMGGGDGVWPLECEVGDGGGWDWFGLAGVPWLEVRAETG